MFVKSGNSVSLPFLIVLVFWLMVRCVGFGLFAQLNVPATAAMFLGGLSVCGAIFRILELNQPFTGLLRIPDTVVRYASPSWVRLERQ